MRATNIAHSTQKQGDIETNNTTAPPNKGPLKPRTPLHPKTAPESPISHPQRRWRFQLKLDLREQKRQGFQPHTGTSKQRRRRFQTTTHLASGIQLHHQRHPCTRPPENSHAIRLGEVSIKSENGAIPTMLFQDSKGSWGNCMRNWLWAQ